MNIHTTHGKTEINREMASPGILVPLSLYDSSGLERIGIVTCTDPDQQSVDATALWSAWMPDQGGKEWKCEVHGKTFTLTSEGSRLLGDREFPLHSSPIMLNNVGVGVPIADADGGYIVAEALLDMVKGLPNGGFVTVDALRTGWNRLMNPPHSPSTRRTTANEAGGGTWHCTGCGWNQASPTAAICENDNCRVSMKTTGMFRGA